MSLIALVAALVALVLAPIWRARLVQPLHDDLREQIEPARGMVTRIHLSLAMEGTLAREFTERRDTLLLVGYREAREDEAAAYRELEPHIERLGPNVRTEFNTLRLLAAGWHSAIDRSFDSLTTNQPTRRAVGATDPFHPVQYEQLLVGAARLDESLSNAAERRWSEAAATNLAQRWLTVVIGLIALGAAMIVAWLGRGLRLYAAAAERARANLEEANEARARIVRGITHDLKNPLNGIVGYTELLGQGVKGSMSPEQLECVERIRRSAETMISLIGDILDMSRAETGQLSINPRPVRIDSIVDDAVGEHAAAATAAGHRIVIDVPPNLPIVATDRLRVRQILGNLLSNAIKYSLPGGLIAVTSAVSSRSDQKSDEKWMSIRVSDNGPGIPEEMASVIFDEFSRLEIHRDLPGAGLGLAIARRISRLLGGDLTVESGKKKGSVFTLWLPLLSGTSRYGETTQPPRDG